MQQLTVNVPDNKLSFFIDLARNLGFTIEGNTPKNILREKQIELLNDARKKTTESLEEFADWDSLPDHVIEDVDEALLQSERGEGKPHEEVMKKYQKWRTK